MKIGLLITSIGNFGQKGFYNAQEIGLAKALRSYFTEVIIYKLVTQDNEISCEEIEGYPGVILNRLPAKNYGINGLLDTSVLDINMDVLVYFSDTQISLPKVYKWTQKNYVQFFPYIGVLESHSTSKLKKIIIDFLFRRNLRVYKRCHCLIKTPTVEQKLHALGVRNTTVTPVGLDLSLLHLEADKACITDLKVKYGYQPDEKIILFIGRLIEEKQPIRMLDIFSQIHQQDDKYRLLMVGRGPLQNDVNTQIDMLGIKNCTKCVDKIPNSDIWELYRIADCFVNLNQQEIFGMAILEAMYYGCKVIAWEAPGPSMIIEDGVSGYLVDNSNTLCDRILSSAYCPVNGKQRVLDSFVWDNMAKCVLSLVQK